MSRTALRRHRDEVHIKRRVRAGHWMGRVKPPGWQNWLSNTPNTCSCYWCRGGRIAVTEFKVRRQTDGKM